MKCSFCGDGLQEGRGKMFVKVSGQVLYFCNSKCQSNWGKKRQGKHTRWTKRFQEEKAK